MGKLSYDFINGKCEVVMLKNHPVSYAHTHDFNEIVIVFSGTAIHFINEEEYPIMSGDVFVIKDQQEHGYSNPKNLSLANVLYRSDYFEDLKIRFNDLPGFNTLFVHEPLYRKKHKFKSKLHLNSYQLQRIHRILNLMITEQDDEWMGTTFSKESIFNFLVVNLCKFYSEVKSPKPKALVKISIAINYIEQNFDKHISNDLLANIAELPKSTFRYLFKKVTGLSPIDYIIRMRIKKAAEIMTKNNRMKIIDVAFAVGFNDSAYFTRKFKEIIGTKPMNFLKKQRYMVE